MDNIVVSTANWVNKNKNQLRIGLPAVIRNHLGIADKSKVQWEIHNDDSVIIKKVE